VLGVAITLPILFAVTVAIVAGIYLKRRAKTAGYTEAGTSGMEDQPVELQDENVPLSLENENKEEQT
jgi:hypothetical protein